MQCYTRRIQHIDSNQLGKDKYDSSQKKNQRIILTTLKCDMFVSRLLHCTLKRHINMGHIIRMSIENMVYLWKAVWKEKFGFNS